MHINTPTYTHVLTNIYTCAHTHTYMYVHTHIYACTPWAQPAEIGGEARRPLWGPLQGLLTVTLVLTPCPARPAGQSTHMHGSAGEQHLLVDIGCLCLEMNVLVGDRPQWGPTRSGPSPGPRTGPLDRAGFDAGRGATRQAGIPGPGTLPSPPSALAATWAPSHYQLLTPGRCDSPRPWARPCLMPS